MNQLTVIFDKLSSKQNRKCQSNILKLFLLFIFLLFIGLIIITMITYVMESNERKTDWKILSREQIKNKDLSDENQQLTNELKKLKQTLSKLNVIILQIKIRSE